MSITFRGELCETLSLVASASDGSDIDAEEDVDISSL